MAGISEFDPDKALRIIREVLPRIRAGLAVTNGSFAELVEDAVGEWEPLDSWLSAGGYPPAAWQPLSKTPKHAKD